VVPFQIGITESPLTMSFRSNVIVVPGGIKLKLKKLLNGADEMPSSGDGMAFPTYVVSNAYVPAVPLAGCRCQILR